MPVLPKEDTDVVRTRSQRQQAMDRGRFEESPSSGSPATATEGVPGPSTDSAASTFNMAALMALLQEQARLLQEQLQANKEEQARRQEEQARRQEEHMRLLQAQLHADKEEQARRQEEQARRQEEQMLLIKDIHSKFVKDLQEVKEQVGHHEKRITEAFVEIADLKKEVKELKITNGSPLSVGCAPSTKGVKVPPFDGTNLKY